MLECVNVKLGRQPLKHSHIITFTHLIDFLNCLLLAGDGEAIAGAVSLKGNIDGGLGADGVDHLLWLAFRCFVGHEDLAQADTQKISLLVGDDNGALLRHGG